MSRLAPYLVETRPTLTLAAPIIVGQLSQMLMGVIDRAMIGRAGTVPLAASAFGGNAFTVFSVVGIGLMLPVSIFVARARGAGFRCELPPGERPGLLAPGRAPETFAPFQFGEHHKSMMKMLAAECGKKLPFSSNA